MQAIIDSDIQAGMDEGGGQEAEATRQRETGRLAVAGTNRQACRQPTGRYKAEGGSQVGARSRHAIRQADKQPSRQGGKEGGGQSQTGRQAGKQKQAGRQSQAGRQWQIAQGGRQRGKFW
jgi:hypothetical protein